MVTAVVSAEFGLSPALFCMRVWVSELLACRLPLLLVMGHHGRPLGRRFAVTLALSGVVVHEAQAKQVFVDLARINAGALLHIGRVNGLALFRRAYALGVVVDSDEFLKTTVQHKGKPAQCDHDSEAGACRTMVTNVFIPWCNLRRCALGYRPLSGPNRLRWQGVVLGVGLGVGLQAQGFPLDFITLHSQDKGRDTCFFAFRVNAKHSKRSHDKGQCIGFARRV